MDDQAESASVREEEEGQDISEDDEYDMRELDMVSKFDYGMRDTWDRKRYRVDPVTAYDDACPEEFEPWSLEKIAEEGFPVNASVMFYSVHAILTHFNEEHAFADLDDALWGAFRQQVRKKRLEMFDTEAHFYFLNTYSADDENAEWKEKQSCRGLLWVLTGLVETVHCRYRNAGKWEPLNASHWPQLASKFDGEHSSVRPPHEWTLTDTWMHVLELCGCWTQLTYTQELASLVNMLEGVCAFLCTLPGDDPRLDLAAQLDEEGGGVKMSFIDDCSCVFDEMQHDLASAKITHYTPAELPDNDSTRLHVEALHKWICTQTTPQALMDADMDNRIQSEYPKQSLYMGELERYLRESVANAPIHERAMETFRMEALVAQQQSMDKGVHYIMSNRLPRDDDLRCCAGLIAFSYANAQYLSEQFEEKYIYLKSHTTTELLADLCENKEETYPVVCIIMNQPGVLYNGKFWAFKAVEEALMVFFKLVILHYEGYLQNASAVATITRDLFGEPATWPAAEVALYTQMKHTQS